MATYADITINTEQMFAFSIAPDGPIDANSFQIASDHPTVANAYPFNIIKGLGPGTAKFTASATSQGTTITESFNVIVTPKPATTLGFSFAPPVPKT